MDRVIDSLYRHPDRELEGLLQRGMHFPVVGRDPFFRDWMAMGDVTTTQTPTLRDHYRRLTL